MDEQSQRLERVLERARALTAAIVEREAPVRAQVKALREERATVRAREAFLEAECDRWRRPFRPWRLEFRALVMVTTGLTLTLAGGIGLTHGERLVAMGLVGGLVALGLGLRGRLRG